MASLSRNEVNTTLLKWSADVGLDKSCTAGTPYEVLVLDCGIDFHRASDLALVLYVIVRLASAEVCMPMQINAIIQPERRCIDKCLLQVLISKY